MGLKILSRKFKTAVNSQVKPFANGNSGAFIEEIITATVDFSFLSSVDDTVITNSPNSLKLTDGSWEDKPFLVGDTVEITFTAENALLGASITVTAASKVISEIDDDLMYFTTDFGGLADFIGVILPSLGGGSACSIVNKTRDEAEEISIVYNWIENSQPFNLHSLIDGSQPTFRAIGIDDMSVSDVVNFVQVGELSGIGVAATATIKRLADVGTAKRYELNFKTFLPSIEDGFLEPEWFTGVETLKSNFQINALPYEGDPNFNMIAQAGELDGNNGWRGEEYNGNLPEFTLDDITLTAVDATVLSAIDYRQKTTINCRVNSDVIIGNFALQINIVPPTEDYKNNGYTFLQNTLSSIYVDSGVGAIQYPKDGMKSEISNVSYTIVAGYIDLEFDVEFNAAAITYLDSLEEQNMTLTGTFISADGSGYRNNEATIVLWEGDGEPQPLVPETYDDVDENYFFLHNEDGTGTGAADYDGCTEDDILYKTVFQIKKADNDKWVSFQTRVKVRNTSDGRSFNLASRTFNFADFVTFGGITNFNINEVLNQFLDGDNRDVFSLNKTTDDATHYTVELNWSFFADWRHWVSLPSAFADFFDLSLPQNGQNREWMRYLREAGWEIILENILVTNGDQAFNWESEILLQDYEYNLDSPDINTVIKFYDPDNNEIDNFYADMLVRVEATHTMVSGSFNSVTTWGWLKIRTKEGEPSKWISTFWDMEARNQPWQPIEGYVKAKLTYPASDVVVVEAYVNSSLLTNPNNTVVARIDNFIPSTGFSFRNVNERDATLLTPPSLITREDRGLDLCKRPFKVLAHVSDSTAWKNDVTGIAFKFDEMTVKLEKEDGTEIDALGVNIAFPYQEDALGFVIDWRQHQEDGVLQTGCYKIKIYYKLGDLEGWFYYGAYNLLNYNINTSEGDARLYVILDDYVRESGINFRDSGFRNSVRFDGEFGRMQPNYDVENIIKVDRTREKIRNEALRTFRLESNFALSCLTEKIDYAHLLAASHIFVSDYNKGNHIQYRDFHVILDEETSPEYTYTKNTPYAKIVTFFVDKVAAWESKFSGKSGVDQPKFGLDPISLGGGGGGCLPVSSNINGNPLTPTPSGGNKAITLVDTDDNTFTDYTIITDNASNLKLEISDCDPVTLDLDGDPLDPTPSGGNRSIKLIDQFDNLLIPTSVVDSPTETTIKVSAVGSIGFVTIPFLDIPTVADGDEGYLHDNYAAFNPYVAPFNAVLPVLDPSDPYAKLLTDNRFGSKWRYTGVTGGYYDNVASQYKDVTGVVTTAALAFPMSGGVRYGIDHYHNIGRKLTREAQAVWTTAIDRDINATYGGLDRWRTNTLAEMNALANVQDVLARAWDTPPFAYNLAASSCTVVASNPTNHYQSQATGHAAMFQQANTTPVITYVCRNHYTI